MDCPCCPGKLHKEYCKAYHTGEKHASTAGTLTHSRFSAFALPNGEYLMETMLPRKLKIIQTPTLNHADFKAYTLSRMVISRFTMHFLKNRKYMNVSIMSQVIF